MKVKIRMIHIPTNVKISTHFCRKYEAIFAILSIIIISIKTRLLQYYQRFGKSLRTIYKIIYEAQFPMNPLWL